MSPPVIAVVAFDGISPFHLSVPCLVFGEDRSELGLPRFEFRVCALERGAVLSTQSGLGLLAPYGLEALEGADIVIVPSWRDIAEPVPAELSSALAAAHGRGALIVGLCLGAFVLAAAGLLDGREATTHWASARRLAEMYPAVRLRPDVLYVDTGDVVTSAGVAAALDCCLHIVRQRHGAEVAQRLARRIVLSPHRQGGQAQYIERPVLPTGRSDRLSRALDAVLADLAAPHSLDSVAAMAGMTRRTFTRHFQRQTGAGFAKWLAAQRVLRAQELLETTQLSIEDIAALTGFGTTTSLRQHFAAGLATSPARYRAEFARRA
jgi:transcriptional regulator GlxA family with amidase domain